MSCLKPVTLFGYAMLTAALVGTARAEPACTVSAPNALKYVHFSEEFEVHEAPDAMSKKSIQYTHGVKEFTAIEVKQISASPTIFWVDIGENDWIGIPVSRFAAVEFASTLDELFHIYNDATALLHNMSSFDKKLSPLEPDLILKSVISDIFVKHVPCYSDVYERRLPSVAQLTFAEAFSQLEKENNSNAAELFYIGLRLDPGNATGIYYLAQSSYRLYANGEEWPWQITARIMLSMPEDNSTHHITGRVTKAQVLELYRSAIAKGLDGRLKQFAELRIQRLTGR